MEELSRRRAKGHFGPPPTEEMMLEWGRHEEELQKPGQNKHSFHTCIAEQPDMEAEVKNWVTGHRNNGISVFTKMIVVKWLHVVSIM